jgi:hypothetical protein
MTEEIYDRVEGATIEENGSSIEELAADPPEDVPEEVEMITGQRQLSLIAGGEEPTSASMRLKGGAVPVEGEFEKGDFLVLRVEARISEIHFIDQIDGSGYVMGAERRHVARIDSVQRIES